MRPLFRTLFVVGAVGAFLPFATGCSASDNDTKSDDSSGDSSQSCLSGKTIDFVVPYSTGGGYDLRARSIAKPLGTVLDATVVVRNEEGAGGLLAANKTSVAKPDGTRIQIVNSLGALSADLAGAEGTAYSSEKFTWLARISDEPDVLVSRKSGSPQDLDELKAAKNARMVAIGAGSNTYIDALVVSEIVGLTRQVIVGFGGAPEVLTSLLRGEADLFASSFSSLESQIKSGDVNLIATFGTERIDSMSDVPTLAELPGLNDDQKLLLSAHGALIATGRAIIAPPDMPKATTECLRNALETVLTDDKFMAEMAAQDRPIGFMAGKDLSDLVSKNMRETPERYRGILEESYAN